MLALIPLSSLSAADGIKLEVNGAVIACEQPLAITDGHMAVSRTRLRAYA
ncbi:MAG: hypothetical protein LBB57_04430 [Clostridiales Family XIII bacterium]|nr:hypothetical protein [Clostridiales Family XIII bacterium]